MNSNKLIVNDHFSPIILWNTLQKHWYKPFIFFGIFFVVGFLYLRYTKPQFNSTAVLQVIHANKVRQVLGEAAPINQEDNLSKDVELLRSPVLFQHAVDALNMNTSVFNEGALLTENLYGYTPFSITVFELKDSSLCNKPLFIKAINGSTFTLEFETNNKPYSINCKLSQPIQTPFFNIAIRANSIEAFSRLIATGKIYFVFNRKQELVKTLQGGLSITPIDENARTIEISFRHENPKLCFNLVQSILTSYFNFEKFKKQEENSQTIAFIDGQLDSLSMVLDQSKDSLSLFQRSNNLPSPTFEESEITQNLTSYSKRIAEINDEISAVKYINAKISSDVSRSEIYRILPELVGRRSFEGSITRQVEELNKLLETKEDLLQDVTYENSKIRIINDRINNRILGVKKSMNAVQDRLTHEKRVLENELAQYEVKLMGLPEKTTEFNRLKYMEELNREYFNLFTQKKIEFQLNNAGFSSENRLLSLPELATEPISPNKTRTYLFVTFCSLILGIGWLVFHYLTYNEITSLTDLKQLLPENATVLGSVPLYKSKMEYSQIIVTRVAKSRISESVRNIKSNLNFINKDAKTIAVSSSISGEGKTFVILNLAATYAASGKRCVVIDLDLRKPKIHHGFNCENQVGMSQVLSGLMTLTNVIQHATIENLDFITAGPIPPNPSDLIQSTQLNDVIAVLKASYDFVFIDNPPVGIVSDGLNVLSQADIPIYVFKANYSKRRFADQLMNLFEIQKIEKINVILNAVPENRALYGYGYDYGYGYNYGGYYSDDEQTSWWKRIVKKFRFKK